MRAVGTAVLLGCVSLGTGCIATASPRVLACVGADPANRGAPSGGRLAVVPSAASDVGIDSSSWHTTTGTEDIGVHESLVYESWLRATRPVPRDELAIVYRAPGAAPTIDAGLIDWTDTLARFADLPRGVRLEPGVPRVVSLAVRLQSGLRIGETSALRHCPGSAQLVPRRDLALHLEPRLTAPGWRDSLLTDRTRRLPPLMIVYDTSAVASSFRSIVVGAVLNTADTTLRNVVAALVLQKVSTKYQILSAADTARRDTLEYLIDSIPAHAVQGFAGGEIQAPTEVVFERAAYPASSVKGRRVALATDDHRTSRTTIASQGSPTPYRILVGEDAADSTSRALRAGERLEEPRHRLLARRAMARIRDPRFLARDSFPAGPAPRIWPEPAWKQRYRSLAPPTGDCAALRAALSDETWHVRLRAMDLVTAECAPDESLARTLETWIDASSASSPSRPANGVSWHAAAHALVALARMRPAETRIPVRVFGTHGNWHLRVYAARAAAVLADTAVLRTLAGDRDDNVKEAAIGALATLTGHADDTLYLAALKSTGAQAVRAAAVALKGSPRADVAVAANASFQRLVARANASERDARVALLGAAGRPASDDRPPRQRRSLPFTAADLALGADVRLRVRMAQASGGGSFVVRLRGDVAPIMGARILQLVSEGYYDGTDWHRVEPDFVIQGGSPGSNEYAGHREYLRDELGTVPHLRGTVGMSTRGHDTGDAQWFVNLKDNRRLDRDYTVFAEVVEGMDVVDGILEGDVIQRIERVAPTTTGPTAPTPP